MRRRWAEEGLPGTVIFLHLSGEMEFMLDHEAIRWGRSLKPGDKVKLQTTPPVPAVVKLALKTPIPPVNVPLVGIKPAPVSPLLKVTVPL